jgi:O-antigen ligase
MRTLSLSSLPERIRHGGREQYLGAAGVMGVGLAVLAILYLGLPLFIIPALIVGALLIILTLRYPTIGVLAVVSAQYLPFTLGQYTVFQMVGGGIAVLTVIFIGATHKGWVFSNMIPPLAAFTLLTLYSLTFTHDTPMTYYLLRKLIFNSVFCLMLVNIVDDFRKLRWLLGVIVGMGVLNSAVGFLQFVGGGFEESRARGLQENENQLGELTALGLMITLYLFLYGKTRRRQVVALVIGCILASGLVTSISRSAVLSLLAGLAWMALWERRYRKRFLAVAVLLAAVVPLLPEAFFHRFENVRSDVRGTLALTGKSGLTDRGYFNRAGLKIWRAHPVLGVGLGNYGYYYILPEFNPGKRGTKKLPPHNLYVQALAETGTVGFLLLLWWIFQVARNYWIAERKRLEDPLAIVSLRACESLTLVALIMYFTSGNLVYTNFVMVMTLSYLCRRSAEHAAASRSLAPGEAPGAAA